MGSDVIFCRFSTSTIASKSSTENAKWRNPVASGLEVLAGGFGKEKSSI